MRMTASVGIVAAGMVLLAGTIATAAGRSRQTTSAKGEPHADSAAGNGPEARTFSHPRVKVFFVPTGSAGSEGQLANTNRTFKVKMMLVPTGGDATAGVAAAPRTVKAKVMFAPTGSASRIDRGASGARQEPTTTTTSNKSGQP
jgi:hypothetical protein